MDSVQPIKLTWSVFPCPETELSLGYIPKRKHLKYCLGLRNCKSGPSSQCAGLFPDLVSLNGSAAVSELTAPSCLLPGHFRPLSWTSLLVAVVNKHEINSACFCQPHMFNIGILVPSSEGGVCLSPEPLLEFRWCELREFKKHSHAFLCSQQNGPSQV